MVGGVVPNAAKIPKRWKLTGFPSDPTAEFQGHTSAIEWPTNQTGVSWRGGDDNTLTDLADGDQLCNITVAQDWTAGSLYRIMREHAGEKATLIFWPEYDVEDYALTADITIIRPPILTNKAGQIIEHVIGCPSTVPVDADLP